MTPKRIIRRRVYQGILQIFLTAGLAFEASAAVPSVALSSGSGAPGAIVTLSATLSSNGGTAPAGVQWDLIFSSADLSPAGATFFTTGTAALAAGKQASCNIVSPSDVRCVVVGLNSTAISDGTIATVSFQIAAGTTNAWSQISFGGVVGTDSSGNPITMSGIGATVTINQPTSSNPVLSNLACSPASFTPPGSSSCTVSLSAAATSATSVNLASNSAALSVPASVSISSGQASANFTASAPSAVTSSSSATITASLSGNVRNFSISLSTSSGPQPSLSSLVCTPTNPVGGTSSYCVIYLSSAAPAGGAAITIGSNNGYTAAPGLVVVPAGLSNANFTVSTSKVTAQQSSILTAGLGSSTVTATLTIEPAAAALSSLNCSPGSIGSAGTSQCIVALTAAAPLGGLTIGLSSNNSVVTTPVAVVIPSGATSAGFTATAGTMSGTVTVTLTASWSGQTATYSLTVSNQSVLSSLTCAPSIVTAGGTSNCSVTLSQPASSGGIAVAIASTDPKITVPVSVMIPAGSTSAAFTALVSSSAANNESAIISASAHSITRTASLTVSQAPSSGSSSLACTPMTVQTPGTSSCLFNLVNPAPAGGLTLALSSSNPNLTVPPSISIGAGLTGAAFTVSASAVTSTTTATIAVSPGNVSQTLNLTPPVSKNISVSSISCNPVTLTGGGTSACQVALTGAAPAGGQGILLSTSSTQLTIPQVVSVTEGASSAPFYATTALINNDEKATLTANLGTSSSQTSLALVGLKPVSLSCSPKSLVSGSPVSCQIALNSAQAASSITLSVSASNNHLAVPASVTSLPGQAAITFQANTSYVTNSQTGTITASYDKLTVQDSVTITPAAPKLNVPVRPTGLPGKVINFNVSATDPENLPVQISVWAVPPNSSFNPNTGVFTWVPDASQIGPHTVHFIATNSAQVSVTQDVVIFVDSTTPVILSLANAASYLEDGGCSPGSVATLLGAGFVSTQGKAADASPIPTEVNGLRVKANDVYLPVFYASDSQVNFQCPALAPGEALTIDVESGTGTSTPLASQMVYATPGIFTLDASGQGQGAILVANTSYIAMAHVDGIPSQPATLGGAISIYATGLGPVQIDLPAGQAASLQKLNPTKLPVSVLIGGINAKVGFAGLAPGFTGLYQVNATIPESAPTGDAISLEIDVQLPDGTVVKSNSVTVAIAAN